MLKKFTGSQMICGMYNTRVAHVYVYVLYCVGNVTKWNLFGALGSLINWFRKMPFVLICAG